MNSSVSKPDLDSARWVRGLLVICGMFFSCSWGCVSCAAYPWIEIADGLDPRGHDIAADAVKVAEFGMVVVFLSIGGFWPSVRLLLAYALIGYVLLLPFRDAETAWRCRTACILLLSGFAACQIARRSESTVGVWTRTLLWAVALAGSILSANAAGRLYLGLEPTSRVFCPDRSPYQGIFATSESAGLEARAEQNGAFRVFRIRGESVVQEPPDKHDRVEALAFAPDGRTLAVASSRYQQSGSEVALWDLDLGEGAVPPQLRLRQRFSLPHGTGQLAFLHNGAWLVAVGGHWHARLWDVASGEELDRFTPIGDDDKWEFPAQAIAVAPDEKTFATVNWGEGWVECETAWSRAASRRVENGTGIGAILLGWGRTHRE